MKISVLMGGTSAERDVSLASGLRVTEALRSKGHKVTAIDTARGPLGLADEKALLARPVVQPEPPSQAHPARRRTSAVPRSAPAAAKRRPLQPATAASPCPAAR